MTDKAHTKMIRPDTLTPCTVEEWENWKKDFEKEYGKESLEKYLEGFLKPLSP